ncbi:hypothetical protein [Amycolatopsis dongchuanensis]|uniref:hypothetical protein n=1 Tax=Amycolatopsis dongchuanensis TaxID=1070866 RepID=UPI003D15785B
MIMGLVIGLTFLFGFGNVLSLALTLGVPVYVAPLIAPAVDLTVLGLLMGTRELALRGGDRRALRPARRLLLGASGVTLVLNVAEPLCTGAWGKAAFDAVGPLLLMGWAEAGPGLLQLLNAAVSGGTNIGQSPGDRRVLDAPGDQEERVEATDGCGHRPSSFDPGERDLLVRARQEDAQHWRRYHRPISAETLRKRMRVGAARSRALVAAVRAERQF